MKVHEKLAALFRANGSKLLRIGFVNGLPGFITMEADGEIQTTALDIEGRQNRCDLCRKEPRQAEAPALSPT